MSDIYNDAESAARKAYAATTERLSSAATQGADSARDCVREQPLTALGIALASGFLLGWVLRKH